MTVRECLGAHVHSASFLARLGKKGAPKVYGRVEEVKEIYARQAVHGDAPRGVYADACNAAVVLLYAARPSGSASKYNAWRGRPLFARVKLKRERNRP